MYAPFNAMSPPSLQYADMKQVGVYGYGLTVNAPLNAPVSLSSAKRLHKTIRDSFGTLVFCRRYLERLGVERYLAGVSSPQILFYSNLILI